MPHPALFNIEIALRSAAHAARRRLGARPQGQPVDVFLCFTDHFEPQVGRPAVRQSRARLQDWMERYPRIVSQHRDSEGRSPRHSFFYPYDEYDEWEFRHLSEFCAAGWGEIELHLHHHDDTEATLRKKLRDAVRLYREHGALSSWSDGRPAWGFIHGNWALDNSCANHCGVNNELTVLAEEGCYADFTFPAWQNPAQPRQLNSIFYATDDPARPKSYDRGIPAQVNRTGAETGTLLLIEGPLVPYLHRSARGLRPAMDDGDLAGYRRYQPARFDRWVRGAGVQVAGRPDRVFIKVHCHGADDRNRETLLGGDLDALFSDAEARYNDGKRYRLHYVTARELFNIVKATEAGQEGDLAAARNWVLQPPSPAVPPLSSAALLQDHRQPVSVG